MDRIYKWYHSLSKRVRDSAVIAVSVVGMISTVLSILGISLGDWEESSFWLRICIVIFAFLIIYIVTYIIIGRLSRSLVKLTIRQTSVSVGCGDIFEVSALRVIGCDTHFDTRVDDIVIAKKSLHGQLFLEHGKKEEIDIAVDAEANRLGLQKIVMECMNFHLAQLFVMIAVLIIIHI